MVLVKICSVVYLTVPTTRTVGKLQAFNRTQEYRPLAIGQLEATSCNLAVPEGRLHGSGHGDNHNNINPKP